MSSPAISYVIYVAATVERLWDALTDPEVLAKNWGRIHSSWAVGAQVAERDDAGRILWNGEVLRCEPPRVLSYTFDVVGSDEPATRVTFEVAPPESPVEPGGTIVQLRLTQVGFDERSTVVDGCR